MQIAEMNPATMNLVELKLGDRVLATMDESVAKAVLHLFQEPGMFMMAEVASADRPSLGVALDDYGRPIEFHANQVEVPVTLRLMGRVSFNHITRRI